MNAVRLVTVLFKNRISFEEIPFLRGCMIRMSGNNDLYHNHSDLGFNYVYPLIQYKLIKGCAAIVGINKGGEAVEQLIGTNGQFVCQLGNRKVEMEVAVVRSEEIFVTCDGDMQTYAIQGWLPLNSINYREYQRLDGLSERVDMLEKILVGNVLSFAKGVGVFLDSRVICKILELKNTGIIVYKDVGLMSFSAVFRSNVMLPDFIGLGKAASINHGVITRIN